MEVLKLKLRSHHQTMTPSILAAILTGSSATLCIQCLYQGDLFSAVPFGVVTLAFAVLTATAPKTFFRK